MSLITLKIFMFLKKGEWALPTGTLALTPRRFMLQMVATYKRHTVLTIANWLLYI